MRPEAVDSNFSLFGFALEKICDAKHPLCRLAKNVDWAAFDAAFGPLYCQNNGRPGKPTRLMVGLHYLKAIYNESDEGLVAKWVENPYWQYFCGEIEFQHAFPVEPTSLGKWRKRVESSGCEQLLAQTIKTGLSTEVLKPADLAKVNVDTTVQEKAIAYPTDARLYHRMRGKLVFAAKELGVELRQTYTKKSQRALIMQGRYRHARQGRRANRELKKLKNYFGRVLRDLDRKTQHLERSEKRTALLALGYRLFAQKRDDKNKVYSLHAPEVECIAKGKAHKKYEFGCKVSIVTSSKGNFVLGTQALHGNPFDGHTLAGAVAQAENLIPGDGLKIKEIFVDRGYRGARVEGVLVHVVGTGLKRIGPPLRKWMKRRAAIEPVIGHMKNDEGRGRNHLLGQEGDRINAILMACGFNMRKCLKGLSLCLFWLLQKLRQSAKESITSPIPLAA